jgi:sugar phosphate isomerase/epimerase
MSNVFEFPSPRLFTARSDRPLSLASIWGALDVCESLLEVDDVLRIAVAQGYTLVEIVGLRTEQAERIGGLIVQEILAEVGLV